MFICWMLQSFILFVVGRNLALFAYNRALGRQMHETFVVIRNGLVGASDSTLLVRNRVTKMCNVGFHLVHLALGNGSSGLIVTNVVQHLVAIGGSPGLNNRCSVLGHESIKQNPIAGCPQFVQLPAPLQVELCHGIDWHHCGPQPNVASVKRTKMATNATQPHDANGNAASHLRCHGQISIDWFPRKSGQCFRGRYTRKNKRIQKLVPDVLVN